MAAIVSFLAPLALVDCGVLIVFAMFAVCVLLVGPCDGV